MLRRRFRMKRTFQVFINVINVALCTHHGLRAMFRGLSPYILKASPLLFIMNMAQGLELKSKQKFESLIFNSIAVSSYLFLYPFEIMRIRMCADVEQNRFYNNLRDCFSKIKKNEGIKSLFRGSLFGSCTFLLQANLLKGFFEFSQKYKKESSLNSIPGNGLLEFGLCLLLS